MTVHDDELVLVLAQPRIVHDGDDERVEGERGHRVDEIPLVGKAALALHHEADDPRQDERRQQEQHPAESLYSTPGGQVTLSFRRSRKVRSKAQLAKIQRTMDDTLASIASMEAEKTKKATTQAIAIGVVAALVLGLGMCCTMVWTHLMIPGIVIGLAGIAGCLYAYVRYRAICMAETARLNPAIEDAYDRLATLCEEAQAVLRVE